VRFKVMVATLVFPVIFATLVSAAIPLSEKKIPIYPDAVRDQEMEKRIGEDHDAIKIEFTQFRASLRTQSYKIYNVDKNPEEVLTFYQEKLGGEIGVLIEPDATKMRPGTILPIKYNYEGYTDADFTWKTRWMKKNIETREKYQGEQWIKTARFAWGRIEKGNDWTEYSVTIRDNSFVQSSRTYMPATQIIIGTIVYKSDNRIANERNNKISSQIAKKEQYLREHPPTEESLGVTFYPGARFDLANSAKMTSSDYEYYIFMTNDDSKKVNDFYEDKTKKKAERVKMLYKIVLEGQQPLPDKEIWIQPNTTYGGKDKTAITIRRKTDHPLFFH